MPDILNVPVQNSQSLGQNIQIMKNPWLLVGPCVVLLVSASDNKPETNITFPLLTPPNYDVRPLLRTFVELQNQWCPSQRYKQIYVLNYNLDQQSEDILTALLKLNEPPKVLSNKRSDVTYWTYESHRCAIMMVLGNERLKKSQLIYYGSRFFIFHPKLAQNTFMEDLFRGDSLIFDKAYHIVYGKVASEFAILQRNYFSNQTISIDPLDSRIPNVLRDLHGRKLRVWLLEGSPEITSFDTYLGETIANHRNASFEVVKAVSVNTDYGVMHMGVPLLGTHHIRALGSTFMVALVPRSKPKSVISVLVDPFDYYTWIGMLVMIATMMLLLSRFGHTLRRLHPIEVGIELIMCILGGPSREYGGWFENQLITTFCLLSIVLVSSYQSLIISYLSVVRYFPDINTAQDIRNRCRFPYDTPLLSYLQLKSDYDIDLKNGIRRDKNLCYLFSTRDNKHITRLLLQHARHHHENHITSKIPANAAFQHNLRIADATFYQFNLLYYFYHKSIIRELFPFFINAFFEAGLFDQYYKNKSFSSIGYQQELFINQSFTVADLSIVWYLFLAGAALSFGCFLLEMTVRHFPAQRLWAIVRARFRGLGKRLFGWKN
ncbi:AGAP013242-PA-like protein [Anopheles sinensis]|uniref:AGAP013242-PA-like protein n=1 Tax=Anopheles sinensis TaxID=74873 RepID=A0A084WP74_ANOSI|nr:AGAP013242-PA-like protein [Anopheles sinensis]